MSSRRAFSRGRGRTAIAGGGGPPGPASITGLRGLYLSDTSLATDQSGTGNTLTLSAVTAGSVQNGHTAARFDGTTSSAVRAVFALGAAGAITIFAVAKVISNGVGDKAIASYGDGAFDAHGMGHNGGVALLQNAVASQVGSGSLAAFRRMCTTQEASAGTDRLYLDGVQDATQSAVGPVANSLELAIGRAAGGGQAANIDVLAVAVYAASLTAPQRLVLDTWAAARYAL